MLSPPPPLTPPALRSRAAHGYRRLRLLPLAAAAAAALLPTLALSFGASLLSSPSRTATSISAACWTESAGSSSLPPSLSFSTPGAISAFDSPGSVQQSTTAGDEDDEDDDNDERADDESAEGSARNMARSTGCGVHRVPALLLNQQLRHVSLCAAAPGQQLLLLLRHLGYLRLRLRLRLR